ncbi:MAG TPA: poly-beta-1,6-N-acetyl-D-glucosamine N-deacetylase PgaB [Candidatus Competibacteraceae bacterium]|nr:poly-beta-1,6-N-acetyl-D-glucosamine N-deacetylase PgaB [Candidatus Competibacteraceae bacterium]
MMPCWLYRLPLCLILLPVLAWAGGAASTLHVLTYHDVVDDLREFPDSLAIETQQLINHFDWLHDHGYTVVSLDQVVAAAEGRGTLPEKAVLLTFDDGYKSVYSKVFPLLELYRYPALVAVVGAWADTPPDQPIDFGGQLMPRSRFAEWRELREMAASGLVEIISHSYDLHHGIPGNPQGNSQPAAVTRRYDSAGQRYEGDAEYRRRVLADLIRSAQVIERQIGRAPRAIAWPYGAYTEETAELARQAGLPITMTLEDGLEPRLQELSLIHRQLVGNNADINGLRHMLGAREPVASSRFIQIDLDYIYDPDPVTQERNLDQLVERIQRIAPSGVYLQAFADPDGDDAADAVYFPNRRLPMRADLFNRVAWQLRTRAGVQVYAWLPVLAYRPPAAEAERLQWVMTTERGRPERARGGRLSPFDPHSRTWIGDLYEDLSKYARIAGVLFHDDAVLSDFEDAAPAALAAYRRQGLGDSLAAIRADPERLARWTQFKIGWLEQFTEELAGRMRRYNPELRTARNLFARILHQPAAETWLAQSLPSALRVYDRVALMAMPGLENVAPEQALPWLRRTLELARQADPHLEKTVFELQAMDWRTRRPLPTETLLQQLAELHRLGARHLAYYPDDLRSDHPRQALIRLEMSVRSRHQEIYRDP